MSETLEGQIKTPTDAVKFILAGNAYFTIRSLKTDTRFTYRVNRARCSRCGEKECGCWQHPLYFVSVLTGPDNESNYSYIGVIKDNLFHRTPKSKLSSDAPSVIAFSWVWGALHILNRQPAPNYIPEQLQIWHEGRCGRCGRKLTVPESVSAGIGPECALKIAA